MSSFIPLPTENSMYPFPSLLFAVLLGCTSASSIPAQSPQDAACSLSEADRAWIERSVTAWRQVRQEVADINGIRNFQAVFFSADCVLTSADALTRSSGPVSWRVHSHDGAIPLPDGDRMPAVVTSFTSVNKHSAFFVMSTPSVWRAGGVDGGALGLETLMVAVMLHEGSHVAQSPTYGLRVEELVRHHSLPESFDDDSLQIRFEVEAAFVASVERETELFFQAALAADDATARALAREARALMQARANRWYTGDDAYWRSAEDVWLTFEGSGQWLGYQWLISERGAGVPVSLAIDGFGRRSKWWSQNQGLAIALVLDRLGGPYWKRHAFGDGEKTLLEMLDATLAD